MIPDVKIRTLIVDDEAPARGRIRQLIKGEADFEIVGECANGRQAVSSIQKEQPDLVFLDVQMPRLNGFEVCQQLAPDRMPLVIFVTAYDHYALQAFEVHAIDYLLKPFDRERFQKSLRHAREQLRRADAAPTDRRLSTLLEDLKAGANELDRLAFKENGRVLFLKTDAVDWVEADGNYVQLHTANSVHQLRETMGWLESRLPSGKFMRISRSVIVNLDRVKELQPLFYGDYSVILQNGARLTLSRNFRERLEKLLSRDR